MKFTLSFKNPDVFDQLHWDDEEARERAKAFTAKYVKYGEYIAVEFDTEAETATVLRESTK